jgi:ZIP family zinc transporter
MSSTLIALLLSTFAGLSTGLGGLVTLFAKKADQKFLTICLSFSSGVMIYIAFVTMFFQANADLEQVFGGRAGFFIATLAFFAGIAIMAITDNVISKQCKNKGKGRGRNKKKQSIMCSMGITTTIAIAIQNFSEGLITFVAALHDTSVGIAVALAIAAHNIPEGIAVAAPVYYATRNKKKAFLYSLMAGATGPIGALIALMLSLHTMSEAMFGIIFAAAAGILVYVASYQLLPTAIKYGEGYKVVKWMFAGMAVMAAVLVVL